MDRTEGNAVAAGPPGGQATDHLAAIVSSSDDAILSKDAEGTITSWNPAAERIYGYSAEEAIGRSIAMLIPGHRRGEERQILDRVLAGKRVDHYETERVTKDGRMLVVSLTVSPIRDEEGRIAGASVIARDITRSHRLRELTARLQDVTSALSRELRSENVVEVILDQLVAGLGADAGAIGVVEGGEVALVGTAGHSSAVSEWKRFPLDADLPMTWAIRTGKAVWAESPGELVHRFPALAQAEIRFPTVVVLPLVVAGEAFGAMSLSFASSHQFDLEERSLIVVATQQAAYALGRARMFETQRAAAEREGFLARAGELLAESLDPDHTLTQLADLVVHHVADWCGIEMLGEDGQMRNVAVAHVDADRVELARQLRERYPTDPDARVGSANVIRSGVSELHPEVTDEMLAAAAQDEEHLRALRELGLRSAMVVPLRARGRVFGAITLVSSNPDRRYGESDLRLAEDLARRASLAVDNAMLFRREHEAALTLQRSLLPQALPSLPGIEFEACYEPATAGYEVGGDWYEVVALEDATVGVTIGDVAGKGIRAGSVMGRVRQALRAYVLEGHGPRDALMRAHRVMKELGRQEMATVFHLHYEPARGIARYVRAGHPPGLLRPPGGAVVELWGEGTPALGILDEIDCREHEVEIPPGSLLLLYTDGLIERRRGDLSGELERLKRLFAEAPPGAAACLEWISSMVGTDPIPDDVAMVAMSVEGPAATR